MGAVQLLLLHAVAAAADDDDDDDVRRYFQSINENDQSQGLRGYRLTSWNSTS